MGLLILAPLTFIALSTSYPQIGESPGPDCPPIGSHGAGRYLLLAALALIVVASLWRMALTAPRAPWLVGTCAALGLAGWLAPWDMSAIPGGWYAARAAVCELSAGPAALSYGGGCLTPVQMAQSGSMATVVGIPADLPFYAIQTLLLLAVLLVAIIAGRREEPGWLRALQIVGLTAGVLGLLSALPLEAIAAVVFLAPGAAIVGLGFLLLAVFAGRAGEEARMAGARRDAEGLVGAIFARSSEHA